MGNIINEEVDHLIQGTVDMEHIVKLYPPSVRSLRKQPLRPTPAQYMLGRCSEGESKVLKAHKTLAKYLLRTRGKILAVTTFHLKQLAEDPFVIEQVHSLTEDRPPEPLSADEALDDRIVRRYHVDVDLYREKLIDGVRDFCSPVLEAGVVLPRLLETMNKDPTRALAIVEEVWADEEGMYEDDSLASSLTFYFATKILDRICGEGSA